MSLPIMREMHFNPLQFFNGLVEASGMVMDFRHQITRSFIARFEGSMASDTMIVNEQLSYSDGEVDHRLWHFKAMGPRSWSATANGIIGTAIIKTSDNNPAHSRWTYQMDVPMKNRTLRFAMQDHMTLVEPNRMVALTPMKKFGLTLAHITSEYRKLG
jgi:hypothetical protein